MRLLHTQPPRGLHVLNTWATQTCWAYVTRVSPLTVDVTHNKRWANLYSSCKRGKRRVQEQRHTSMVEWKDSAKMGPNVLSEIREVLVLLVYNIWRSYSQGPFQWTPSRCFYVSKPKSFFLLPPIASTHLVFMPISPLEISSTTCEASASGNRKGHSLVCWAD